jgi:TolA-binding protein
MSLEIQPKTDGQQPEADVTITLLTWLEENKKLLAVGFGLISAAVVFLIIQRNVKASAELKSNQALFAALQAATKTGGAPASALASHAAEHPGTKAAERSLLLSATKLFEEGKYAEAQKAFESFNQEYPDSALGATATLGIASSLDAQNKAQEAITAYQNFIAGFSTDPLATQAKLSKARVHESLKQFKEAVAIYDEVLRGSPGQAAQEAAIRKATLVQEHPEVTPPAPFATNSVNVTSPVVVPAK